MRGELAEVERQHAAAEDSVARLEGERHQAEIRIQQVEVQLQEAANEAITAREQIAELKDVNERKCLSRIKVTKFVSLTSPLNRLGGAMSSLRQGARRT